MDFLSDSHVLFSLAQFLVIVIPVGFFFGKLNTTLTDLVSTVSLLRGDLKDLRERDMEHERRISRLEGQVE